MLVVGLDEGSEMDALTAILLPALGTYDGRLVVVTEVAISCTVPTRCYLTTNFHTSTSKNNKARCLQIMRSNGFKHDKNKYRLLCKTM